MVQIKSTVLEIVHEIPEVIKLLVSEENERNQVEEINQEEKVRVFFHKGRQGARSHRWTHMQKTPTEKCSSVFKYGN